MRVLPVPIAIAVLIAVTVAFQPAIQSPPVAYATLFDLPLKRIERLRLQQLLLVSVAQKNLEAAAQVAQLMIQLEPDRPANWYNLASVQATSGNTKSALTSLRKAVELGFRDVRQLESDTDFNPLRSDPAFEEIMTAAKVPFIEPKPATPFMPGRIENGVAMVTEQNTRWDEGRMSLISSFEPLPKTKDSRPQIVGTSAPEIAVNAWIAEGTAAGFHGDLYDNRDRDHSNLNLAKFPGLVHVEYSPEASKAGADWGMRIGQAFEQPTFGNSSTARVDAPYWRSNPRMLMHEDLLMKLAYNQFVNNQLYCYPEHNDFDPEHGDVYPANTPFWVISQGSSGSDQPFMEAIALTLAAFRPEVKRTLVEKHMLIPVIQMLLRRSQKSVRSDEDYFSGRAHPVVFQSAELDPLRMVRMAHELTVQTLPALVLLKVVEEDLGVPGKDYFHPAPAEQLFNTPAAIARVYRSTAYQKRMVIDASESVELNGRPLKFHWNVLQGDPTRVQIRPLTDNGSRAEVVFEWHDRSAIFGVSDMQTNRVDIGVFALTESAISLPAFVSSFSLANEKRVYNDQHLIQSVDYGDPVVSRRYVDPLLDIPKSWRDDYHYAADNTLVGWTRTAAGEKPLEFSAEGRLILKMNEAGEPVEWHNVHYEAVAGPAQAAILKQVETP